MFDLELLTSIGLNGAVAHFTDHVTSHAFYFAHPHNKNRDKTKL